MTTGNMYKRNNRGKQEKVLDHILPRKGSSTQTDTCCFRLQDSCQSARHFILLLLQTATIYIPLSFHGLSATVTI